MAGIFGDTFDNDERERLWQLGFVPGLGFVLPVAGLSEPELIIKRNLRADEFVHPSNDWMH
jgi:hypothetical protein